MGLKKLERRIKVLEYLTEVLAKQQPLLQLYIKCDNIDPECFKIGENDAIIDTDGYNLYVKSTDGKFILSGNIYIDNCDRDCLVMSYDNVKFNDIESLIQEIRYHAYGKLIEISGDEFRKYRL